MEVFQVAVMVAFLVLGTSALNYQKGQVYHYTYENEVRINDKDREDTSGAYSDVGFKLTGQVDLAVVWENDLEKLFKLTVSRSTILNVAERPDEENIFSRPLSLMTSDPLYFSSTAGKVSGVYSSPSESTASLNAKKGIVGLFQLQEVQGTVTETDASGECQVTYIPQENQVLKVRDTQSCKKDSKWVELSHFQPALGVTVESDSSAVYLVSPDTKIIKSALSRESHASKINLRESISSSVISSQSLNFVSSEATSESLQGESAAAAATSQGGAIVQSLTVDPIFKQCGDECQSLSDVVAANRESLASDLLAQPESSNAFLQVLEAARRSSKQTIQDVLQEDDNGDITTQLLDVVASAQTQEAFEGAMELLDFADEDLSEIIERFLVVTGFNTHPSEGQIQSLLDMYNTGEIGSNDVRESLALTIGALLNSFCQSEANCQSQVGQDALNLFLDGLKSTDAAVRKLCLYGLKNAARPSTIPTILEISQQDEDQDVIEVAVDILNVFPPQYFTREVKRVLNNFYHQNHKRYSNVIRVSAVNLLLSKNPSDQDVINVAISLPHLETFELGKYILSKLETLSRANTEAGMTIRAALEASQAVNYANIIEGGFSKSYKNILAETKGVTCAYDLNLQMTGSGLLRKSNFDVELSTSNNTLSIISIGLYSRGLESFFGEDTGDSGDVAAGVAAQLMGIQLRPLSFMAGGTNLMSMAWSLGSASDTNVSPLHGTVLIHDHSKKLVLQSGHIVDLEVQGSASVDMGGNLDFSLWDRTFTTTIFNKGAMSIRGTTGIDNSIFKTGIQYGADATGVVNFVTTVQFSSLPPSFCLQMMQDPIQFRQFARKVEQAESSENSYSKSLSKYVLVDEVSFKLFDENSAPCEEMFGDDEDDDGGWW